MGASESNFFVDLSFFRLRVGEENCLGLLLLLVWEEGFGFDFRFGRGGGGSVDVANGLFCSSHDALFFPLSASFRFLYTFLLSQILLS